MGTKYRIKVSYPCCDKNGKWIQDPNGEGDWKFETKIEAMQAQSRLQARLGTYECKRCGVVSQMSDATYAVTGETEGGRATMVEW